MLTYYFDSYYIFKLSGLLDLAKITNLLPAYNLDSGIQVCLQVQSGFPELFTLTGKVGTAVLPTAKRAVFRPLSDIAL